MLNTIRTAWGWTGIDPEEIVIINQFGNVVVRANNGTFWRICPEEWSCTQIARNAKEYTALSGKVEFRTDWDMERLVDLAREEVGPLTEGLCYCLKLPAVIGGKYKAANLGIISIQELIAFSGDMAEQIKDVPDGDQIQIDIIS
jgi:hypothetical protein